MSPALFPGTGTGIVMLCYALCVGRQRPLAELPCRGRVASLNLTPCCPLGFACVKVLLLCARSHRARGAEGKWSHLTASGSAWQGSAFGSAADVGGGQAPCVPLWL